MHNDVFVKVDDYIAGIFNAEDEILLSVNKSLDDANIPRGSISANQGMFLHTMALACKARNILELGTLGGYSTIWLARSLPDKGRLITIELEPSYAGIAKKNIDRARLSDKVEIRVGKAFEILKELQQENIDPFDLVFMDADKPHYCEYFIEVLKLSHPGTLIIADNVIREGQVMNPDIIDDFINGIQRFNKLIASYDRVNSTILQTVGSKPHDGMSISVVKY